MGPWEQFQPQSGPWEKFKPADSGLGDIRQKAIAALPEHMQETARTALSQLNPTWEHNKPGYSPYKPADPNNMPNDAINPVGTDLQAATAAAAAGAGSVGARMLARASEGVPPGPIPQAMPPVNMSQMPTQQAATAARGLGGPAAPSSPIGGPPPAAPRGGVLGKVLTGGAAHTAAGYLPHPYNDMAHFGLRTLGL